MIRRFYQSAGALNARIRAVVDAIRKKAVNFNERSVFL
jgi:hypothetical protein